MCQTNWWRLSSTSRPHLMLIDMSPVKDIPLETKAFLWAVSSQTCVIENWGLILGKQKEHEIASTSTEQLPQVKQQDLLSHVPMATSQSEKLSLHLSGAAHAVDGDANVIYMSVVCVMRTLWSLCCFFKLHTKDGREITSVLVKTCAWSEARLPFHLSHSWTGSPTLCFIEP